MFKYSLIKIKSHIKHVIIALGSLLDLVPFVCASRVINTLFKATREAEEGTLLRMEKEKNYAAPSMRKVLLVH